MLMYYGELLPPFDMQISPSTRGIAFRATIGQASSLTYALA